MAKKSPKPSVNYSDRRTECPLTLAQFAEAARAAHLRLQLVDGTGKVVAEIPATVKAPFSTGSFGWNVNGQTNLALGGEDVKVQIGCNVTVANSKEADRE